jgi:hypothetical protein
MTTSTTTTTAPGMDSILYRGTGLRVLARLARLSGPEATEDRLYDGLDWDRGVAALVDLVAGGIAHHHPDPDGDDARDYYTLDPAHDAAVRGILADLAPPAVR